MRLKAALVVTAIASALSVTATANTATNPEAKQAPNAQAHEAHVASLDKNTNPAVRTNPIDLRSLPSDMDFLFPLTPEERLRIRERQLDDQNAAYQPLRSVDPLRDLVSISGNADTIPEVFVTPDYPSAVVFTDLTGAPWPIQYIGQTGSLATVQQPEGSDNALVLMANNGAGRKSVSVFLEGLTLPVTLTVTGKNNEYHALKHIRITERGPNSSVEQTIASSASAAPNLNPTGSDDKTDIDSVLNKLAYKVTPEGYKKLRSSDPRVDGWINPQDNKYMFVRTDYTVVSPAPRGGNRSVTPIQDNVRIYLLPRINPIMALDESGQRHYLTFKE